MTQNDSQKFSNFTPKPCSICGTYCGDHNDETCQERIARLADKESATVPDTGEAVIPMNSLRVADDLPATPRGLLEIADVFERGGYHRLATYLRACADQMAGKLPASEG